MNVYFLFLTLAIIGTYFFTKYIIRYLKLTIYGGRAHGEVGSFKMLRSNPFLNRVLIPKVTFTTETNQTVSEYPKHTLFIELFQYESGRKYRVKYDRNNSTVFIIENPMELFLLTSSLFSCLAYILWMVLRFL